MLGITTPSYNFRFVGQLRPLPLPSRHVRIFAKRPALDLVGLDQLDDRLELDLARWKQAMRQYLGPYYDDENAEISISEEQLGAELERFSAVCRELWARPVRDWEDLAVLAAVAVYWNSDSDDSGPFPHEVLNGWLSDPTLCADSRSLAFLVRGILEVTGLHFAVRARLLTSLNSQASQAEPLPQLATNIRDKIGELRAAYDRLGLIDDDHAYRAVEAEIEALIGGLNALEAQIPNPPRSLADVAMRAEIALYWTAEETVDALKDTKEQDEIRMGSLIEVVHKLAERGGPRD